VSQFVAIKFTTAEQAHEALDRLRGLQKEGAIHIEDSAVVERAVEGEVHTDQQLSGTTKGAAAIGGFVGLLVGGVLFPVAGMAIGAAAGGAVGASLASGVDQGFVKDVQASIEPGTSALFLVVDHTNVRAALAAIEQFHGEVLQTSLDPELEDQLRDALR
jgi:uncharacterized membrane protein